MNEVLFLFLERGREELDGDGDRRRSIPSQPPCSERALVSLRFFWGEAACEAEAEGVNVPSQPDIVASAVKETKRRVG